MAPHKSDACRKEIETLLEFDMIETSKSPWACQLVMAIKKGDQQRFCYNFRYLNSVTAKGAYPKPRIDESLSKMGMRNFLQLLIWRRLFGRCHLENKTKTNWALLVSWDCVNGRGCHLVYATRQLHFSDWGHRH